MTQKPKINLAMYYRVAKKKKTGGGNTSSAQYVKGQEGFWCFPRHRDREGSSVPQCYSHHHHKFDYTNFSSFFISNKFPNMWPKVFLSFTIS